MANQQPEDVAQQTATPTILVHGIWMHGVFMQGLAHYLKKHGYCTTCLSYNFWGLTPAENAKRIYTKIQAMNGHRVHLVGHSLGGIVILHLLQEFPELPVDKVVLIGSPVQGSAVAKKVHQTPILRYFLGKSTVNGLLGGAPSYAGIRPLGIITGKGQWGITSVLFPAGSESDGVVKEHETLMVNTTARVSLPLSHSALIFSKRCARYIANFLATARFE